MTDFELLSQAFGMLQNMRSAWSKLPPWRSRYDSVKGRSRRRYETVIMADE